jgi:AmiR/NasT family two-component response regulator
VSDGLRVEDQTFLRRLRQMRVLVVHPHDGEQEVLLAHLKRIGCPADHVWPAPKAIEGDYDVVFYLLSQASSEDSMSWLMSGANRARIGIISYETPEILGALERSQAHGVLSKPIRVFGVLAAMTVAIGMVRYENRLQQRIRSLDENLKARRRIEEAVSIISKEKGISEDEAYRRIREKSMRSKVTIASVAEAIIAASDI